MLTESGMFLLILNEATPSETGAYICINQLEYYREITLSYFYQIRVYGSIPKIYVVVLSIHMLEQNMASQQMKCSVA